MAVRLTRTQAYVLLFATVLLCGTLAIMIVERLDPFDALYFVIVTVATVGYGDIAPTGTIARAVTILVIIAGVGTFVAVFANIIEGLLSREELRERRKKVNMIIGVFLSEFGNPVLTRLSRADPCISVIRERLLVSENSTAGDFEELKRQLTGLEYCVTAAGTDMPELKEFLEEKRGFLLSLLEHPAIFEHDTFTSLLRAFFHLTEELSFRKDLRDPSPADAAHLVADINRAYRLLVLEWVTYMDHLREQYPYLFSLAIRMNPFDPDAAPEIR